MFFVCWLCCSECDLLWCFGVGCACLQVTGVGYDASGEVICNREVVRDGSNPSVAKVMEVGDRFTRFC